MPRRTISLAASLALVFSAYATAVAAPVPVDLTTWTTYNQPNSGMFTYDGNWTLDATETAVTQSVNGLPTFFIAPGDITGHRFTATLGSNGPDNDFFGIALGFSTGADADYVLIDWRSSDQTQGWADGPLEVTGYAGLAVSTVEGVATLSELWAHSDYSDPNGAVTELARGATLGSTGWIPGESYEIVVEYTTTSLDVWVDGSHEISLAGDFPAGPVALYNFSEPGMTASGIGIETLNDPPSAVSGGASDVAVFEGQLGATSGAFIDPDGDSLSLSCSGPCEGFTDNLDGTWTWSQLQPEGPHDFNVQVSASDGEYTTVDEFEVSVQNLAPEIVATASLADGTNAGLEVTRTASFVDDGVLDSHTAFFNWGDGTSSEASVTESEGSGVVEGHHTYSEAGFYTISVTVIDDDGGRDTAVLGEVFVYDPNTFVTGGGWVRSPEGAYVADSGHTGKATFGFNVRYDRNGDARGSLQLQVHNEMSLHARSFDFLWISDGIARFTGLGAVNGESGYEFRVVAKDERHASSTTDRFWITVSGPEGIVYDGAAYPSDGLPVTGKGIQIHTRG